MNPKNSQRKYRLKRIKEAQLSIEDSLLEMRKCKNCNPTLERDEAFEWLYYLVRLAKKNP